MDHGNLQLHLHPFGLLRTGPLETKPKVGSTITCKLAFFNCCESIKWLEGLASIFLALMAVLLQTILNKYRLDSVHEQRCNRKVTGLIPSTFRRVHCK
ncbi:hypothetical protein AQUCO_00900521v1 [Aquilegia coerulea]|uniref:Uncharacterized protein n=1 Tax=Aquilegia coerulea TaxID=218851 RepID=A0A2G5EE58_AQUCA|nr:hypothetical protein AQUCO_00900521v1 [Aquilegia coerulea]